MNLKLIGKVSLHLDDKNRFIIPKRFIDKYNSTKIAYALFASDADVPPHLDVFLDEDDLNDEIEKRMKTDGVPYAPDDYVLDKYLGNLYQLSVDMNGRTSSIPQFALDDSKITGDMIIVGKGCFFSVFDPEIYDEYLSRQQAFSGAISKSRRSAFEKYNKLVASGEFLPNANEDGENA